MTRFPRPGHALAAAYALAGILAAQAVFLLEDLCGRPRRLAGLLDAWCERQNGNLTRMERSYGPRGDR